MAVAQVQIGSLVEDGEKHRGALDDVVVVDVAPVRAWRAGGFHALARRRDADAAEHGPHRDLELV